MSRKEVRYLTDDCDMCDMEMRMSRGENGDWYLSILPKGDRFTRHTVRITTSGNRNHAMPRAAYELWLAMRDKEEAP